MVISKSNGAKNSTDPIRRSIVLIASEQKLIMMRPYQVYAVKHIVTCIHEDSGNGIIWHTTGSGKTLTSFKASTLATLRDTLLPKMLSGELSVNEHNIAES